MRLLVAGALLLGSLSCVSDRERVSNALAAHHYEAGHCAIDCCVHGTGIFDPTAGPLDPKTGKPSGLAIPCVDLADAPATCPAWKKANNQLLDEVTLANGAQSLGKLPKNATARLKALTAEVQKEGKP